ncbi:major capsid protein [Acinetobacter towneri]|uniref:major capsid protein n=1 Tax=Acinetobacter towneri TaxID=202956 RepID=UPI0020970C53|nr:major capsid protein [Acinetobacter towneri]MCO8058161.1 major capsid protein [Acinetobacter towneri]MCO8063808.1 major capsid protein [Acinetobacter towneri]
MPNEQQDLITQAQKVPGYGSMIADNLKTAFSTRSPKIATAAFASAVLLCNQAYAEGTAVDLGIDAESLKSLILGLIATIAVIGTAYLTVLVAISAFSMIRRVVRG